LTTRNRIALWSHGNGKVALKFRHRANLLADMLKTLPESCSSAIMKSKFHNRTGGKDDRH
ncbi:MAG: hypothetical protein AAB286_05210, partial [Pseudomonadota bacterium]